MQRPTGSQTIGGSKPSLNNSTPPKVDFRLSSGGAMRHDLCARQRATGEPRYGPRSSSRRSLTLPDLAFVAHRIDRQGVAGVKQQTDDRRDGDARYDDRLRILHEAGKMMLFIRCVLESYEKAEKGRSPTIAPTWSESPALKRQADHMRANWGSLTELNRRQLTDARM